MYFARRTLAYSENRTPRELLADQRERQECQAVLSRGGKYYEGPAPRPTIVAAIAILRARHNRKSCRGIAEKARRDEPGRILRLQASRQAQRERAKRERWNQRVATSKLGLSTVRRTFRRHEAQQRFLEQVSPVADGAVELIARAVGRLGDQAEHDLEALRTSSDFAGKQGRHHRYEQSTLSRLQILPDWSAVLVTIRDYKSFGSAGFHGYEKRGGSSFRVYLIVRDTTTGEAHLLRVPPKYGNDRTQFFGKFEQQTGWGKRLNLRTADQRRIHAAVAWTFGLEPHQYKPAVQT